MLSKFGSKVSSRFGSLDPLIIFIVLAVIVAIFFPISGRPAEWFSTATVVAVAVLFFLYGARLSTREALDGLTNWRLHATILAFTFVLFPLIGVALRPVGMAYNPELYMGVLYLTLVPSTVQSSVAFTSIARGNVAGAIVSASASNVLGVVATPALVMLLMSQRSGGSGVVIDAHVFGDIALQLLLPFILGQFARRWGSVAEFAAKKATKLVDRGSIVMVVYSAFSAGVVAGVWSTIGVRDIVILCVFSVVLVAFMLWLSRFVALRLGFDDADMKAIQFCGFEEIISVWFTHGCGDFRELVDWFINCTLDDLPPNPANDVFVASLTLCSTTISAMSTLYIRVDLTVPQIGVSTHIAELVEQSPQLCAMQRIIELDPSGAIQGAATPKVTVGMASAPEPIVPHPDTYADFPDITSTPIDVELFDALWAEAIAKFPELA